MIKQTPKPAPNALGIVRGLLPNDILTRLPTMPRDEFDHLPIGAIQVDDAGVILQFNRAEGDMTGFRPRDVEGRNLFFELAPCMNNNLVFGKFRAGVDANSLDHEVLYALTYRMRPVLTQIRLWRDPATNTNWVLLGRVGSVVK